MSETITSKWVRFNPPINFRNQLYEIGQERTATGVDSNGVEYTRIVDQIPVELTKEDFLAKQEEAKAAIQSVIDEVSVL